MRSLMLLGAVGLALLLALDVLGVSVELGAVALVGLPVLLAWVLLCGKLSRHEHAIDAMLDERRATLRGSLAARKAYTGETVRLVDAEGGR